MSHTAGVDEILLAGFNPELGIRPAPNRAQAFPDKGHRHVRVAKETDRRVLAGETRRGRKSVKDITPALRFMQRRMNDGKACHLLGIFQIPEPEPVILSQLGARPLDRLGRVWIEVLEIRLVRTILVVIPFHARNPHATDDIHAFLRFVVVPDDITEADRVCAAFLLRVEQDRLEGLEMSMDVGNDGVFNCPAFQNFR